MGGWTGKKRHQNHLKIDREELAGQALGKACDLKGNAMGYDDSIQETGGSSRVPVVPAAVSKQYDQTTTR